MWREERDADGDGGDQVSEERKCKGCGGEIPDTRNASALYCSKRCSKRASKRRESDKNAEYCDYTCPICGKTGNRRKGKAHRVVTCGAKDCVKKHKKACSTALNKEYARTGRVFKSELPVACATCGRLCISRYGKNKVCIKCSSVAKHIKEEQRKLCVEVRQAIQEVKRRILIRDRVRWCSGCKQYKPLSDIAIKPSNYTKIVVGGSDGRCKGCTNEYNKKWRWLNKDHHLGWNKRYLEMRMRDVGFRIHSRIRQRMQKALKRHALGCHIQHGKFRYLGATLQQVINHLESKFDDKMTWQNYGSYWHIDHIMPVSAFDLRLEADRCAAFHYTNLQPLEKVENIRKSNRIPNIAAQMRCI